MKGKLSGDNVSIKRSIPTSNKCQRRSLFWDIGVVTYCQINNWYPAGKVGENDKIRTKLFKLPAPCWSPEMSSLISGSQNYEILGNNALLLAIFPLSIS